MFEPVLISSFWVMAGSVTAAIAVAALTRSDRTVRIVARLLGLGAVAALAMVTTTVLGTDASTAGITIGGFSAIVVLLVTGMGATVVEFSRRNLRGEAYQHRFVSLATALIGSGVIFAITTNLIVLALAWIVTSQLTVALIRTGPQAGADTRSLRARRAFAIGDTAIIAAITTLVISSGSTSIDSLRGAGDAALAVAGLLLVLAALTRSASGPFVRWLPDSLGAPTSSSALLHAGVVNGGAILLIRLSPAVAEIWPAAIFAAIAGGVSCVFAEAVMMTRPDIKGRLAWSTIAQMSFTVLLCGLGLNVAAGLHLVAHGFYKGALFLGSGSAVRGLVRQRMAPPVRPTVTRQRLPIDALASTATAAAIVATTFAFDVRITAELAVPLILAWVAGTCAVAAGARRVTSRRHQAEAVLLGMAAMALFVAITIALKRAIGPSVVAEIPVLSAIWVVPILAGLAIVAATRSRAGRWTRVLEPAWAAASHAGQPRPPLGVRSSPVPLEPDHSALPKHPSLAPIPATQGA